MLISIDCRGWCMVHVYTVPGQNLTFCSAICDLCSNFHLAPVAQMRDKACGKATIKKALRGREEEYGRREGGWLKLHFETSSLHINCYILI